MNTKNLLLAGAVLLGSLGVYSCNKKEIGASATEKATFISARSFVGTSKQFEEYQKLFLKQNQFPYKMSDKDYEEYVAVVNSPNFQKQYFEMQEEKLDVNKPRIGDEANNGKMSPKGTFSPFGTYPRTKGYLVGTDNPSSSNAPLFTTGHTAIVMDYWETMEAMPEDGVQYHNNDWYYRYESRWNVYGLKVGAGLTQWHYDQAADWVKQQKGKPYNWNFLYTSTRDSFYCSQLAYAAYRDVWNVRITTVLSDWTMISPASIYNSNNTLWIYAR